MYGSTYAIAEENNFQRITICTIAPGATTLDRTAPGNVTWSTPLGNLGNFGLECMCYDAGRDRLYYVAEKPSGGTWNIYSMNPATGASTVLCNLNTTLFTAGVATDLSDMAHDRATDTLLLLSEESNKVIRVSRTGAVLETKGFTTPFTQAEALALTPDRQRLFIGGEPKQFARYALPAGNLTFTVSSAPAHGTLSGLPPLVTYTPNANYQGPDSFSFTVSDGIATSAPATVSITVTPFNAPPAAESETVNLNEDAPAPVTLMASDPEHAPLTWTVATLPQNGVLTGTAPALTFTPDANYYGTDSFTFYVSDGVKVSTTATITLVIAPINDAPSVQDRGISVQEDAAVALILSGEDIDGDNLDFAITSAPAHGSLTGTAPNLTYTPAPDYSGPDSFSFIASDAAASSQPAVVTVTVNAVNDPPAAAGQSLTLNEETATGIHLTASDADGDALSFALITVPLHGTLSGNAPDFTYTPVPNFHGSDSFTFTANDGTSQSAPATITLEVLPANDAPVAAAQTLAVDEDTSLPVILTAEDIDGDPLSFVITIPPQHGTLTGNAPHMTYTPDANYSGSDSFAFTAKDETSASAATLIDIVVVPVNDAPAADSQSPSTPEDTPLPVSLEATDAEEDALSYLVTELPAHGTLSGTAPNLIYTPAANYHGSDRFTFAANDGAADSAPVEVNITVVPVNDAPLASQNALSTNEDVPLDLTLSGTDADGDDLNYTISTPPAHGLLSGTAPTLTYTPAPNYHGPDSFSFVASDGTVTSSPAVVSIDVVSINDTSVAVNQTLSTNEDTPLTLQIEATDVDGDALTFSIPSLPAHGILLGSAPNLIYLPDANYHGDDSFSFVAADGISASAPATVILTINTVNDVPLASTQDLITAEDTPVALSPGGTDPDGDALECTIIETPRHGTLHGTLPDLVYTPAPNYSGPDAFKFVAGDGTTTSEPATIVITVTPVNDAPAASPLEIDTSEDTTIPVVLTGTDIDGDQLSFTITLSPAHGTLSGSASELLYTPDPNYFGADRFWFIATDVTDQSTPVAVDITVSPVNDAPVARWQVITGLEDTALPVTLRGTDTEGDALHFIVTEQPAHGTLTGTPPLLTYSPTPNFHGVDHFEYIAEDGLTGSGPATVEITVGSVNDVPSPTSQTVTTSEDVPLALALTGTDADGDVLDYVLIDQPAHGSLSGLAPDLIYTPDQNYHGPDSFSFSLNDDSELSPSAVVSIQITPVNDAPVASSQTLITAEDIPLAVTPIGSDVEAQALSFVVTTLPVHGTLSDLGGQWLYTPNANFHGQDSLAYKASDGTIDSLPATVTITVASVNDAPAGESQALSTYEDTALLLMLEASDADGDPLVCRIVEQPAHGALTGTPPSLTYTPRADFNGTDKFTFMANDGTSDSLPAEIEITVSPVNDDPVAVVQSLVVNEDTALPVILTGADTEGAPISFTVTAAPEHGVLSGTAPNLIYLPEANFHGADGFRFTVSDENAISSPANVSISVTPINDEPVAGSQSLETEEDTSLTLVIGGQDADGESLAYAVTEVPAHGTLSGTAPDLVYTPAEDYHGPDSFTFTATDAAGSVSTGVIAITVIPVDDPPMPLPQSLSTNEDTPVNVTLGGVDTEGDAISYRIASAPIYGTLSGVPPVILYTPAANYNGPDSFLFTASNGGMEGIPTLVQIYVAPVNDAPDTAGDLFSTNQDNTLTMSDSGGVLLNDSDLHEDAPGEDNGPLTAVAVSPPAHAESFVLNPDGSFHYTPALYYYGTDSFTYQALDSMGAATGEEIVRIIVRAANRAPLVESKHFTTLEGNPVTVTLHSTDPDLFAPSNPDSDASDLPAGSAPAPHNANPLYTIAAGPLRGTLSGTAPFLTYTPAPGFSGDDSFSFAANDGRESSLPATISVTIIADSDADGLPDTWEITAFGSLIHNGGDDPDGDDEDNAFEYVSGHHPGDGSDFLRMECIGPAPDSGLFLLSRVIPGVRYQLNSSTDLESWDSIAVATYETTGPETISDPRPLSSQRRFYRVSVSSSD